MYFLIFVNNLLGTIHTHKIGYLSDKHFAERYRKKTNITQIN